MDPTRDAAEVWEIHRKPVDILGRLMIRVDFGLKGCNTTIHHKMCGNILEADAECAQLKADLHQMMDGPFRAKYRIAHDLRGGF